MRILFLLGALAAALLAAFVTLNWQAVASTQPANLGFASFDAPVGLVVLGLCLTVMATFGLGLASQVLSGAKARRAQTRALEVQRTLANDAEASRYHELRAVLLGEFERLAATLSESQDALRVEIQDTGNSIAAMLAEIDDRTRRASPLPRDDS